MESSTDATQEAATDSHSATPSTPSTSAPRSLFDSRTLARGRSGGGDDDDVDLSARYLSHNNSNSSMTFNEAFAAIRQTASYTNPPPIAVESLPVVPQKSSSNRDAAMIVWVNRCQTGNPLLKAVKNVTLEFRDGLAPDYVVNASCCVLFLSVRYHLLHGHYLEERIERVRKDDAAQYKNKVVLCLVDVEDNETALREINRITLLSQFTLILSWSWLEAARYIETLKAYENKAATLIKEKVDTDFLAQANDVLTTVRSVNKTDVVTLLSTFGSMQGVFSASLEELSLCPGIGAKKVRQLLETFNEPFTKTT
ncbi:hypothetical protein PINS_up024504 [Pythium insidiosum]|nr:hypothetical protein PINS_up024504 [Pythium insidiosum]